MLADEKLREFVARELGGGAPAPGGGSAAALAGAMAAALSGMVARLTLGREKFAAAAATMADCLAASVPAMSRLLELVDLDAAAYDGVVAARRLPRATDDERRARAGAVAAANARAAEVPAETAALCLDVLRLVPRVLEAGNPAARSDAAVAGLLALAGLRGALCNVRINLDGLESGAAAVAARHADEMEREAAGIEPLVRELSRGLLGGGGARRA